jgi:hypothetical protein
VRSRLLFLHRDRYGPIRPQAYFLPFDFRDQRQIDKMVLGLVPSSPRSALASLILPFSNAIDNSDMNAVCSDHFHMSLDLVTVAHLDLSFALAVERAHHAAS